MERSPLSTIAVLGCIGAVGLVLMFFMGMSSMTDPRAANLAKAVHDELARSLDPDKKSTRLTMRSEGPEGARTLHYTLRLRPSRAVAANEEAVKRLLLRGAEITSTKLGKIEEGVTLVCRAEMRDGTVVEAPYRRVHAAEVGYVLEASAPARRVRLEPETATPSGTDSSR
jgi:hypothetical protein